MKFTLEIQLGNAGMSTGYEIAEALKGVAQNLEASALCNANAKPETWDAFDRKCGIRDVNGNRVGEWKITADITQCPACAGSGTKSHNFFRTEYCPTCNGSGQKTASPAGEGEKLSKVYCVECGAEQETDCICDDLNYEDGETVIINGERYAKVHD